MSFENRGPRDYELEPVTFEEFEEAVERNNEELKKAANDKASQDDAAGVLEEIQRYS